MSVLGLRRSHNHQVCNNLEIENKTVYEPTDKTMIFNRLLKIPEDYNILGIGNGLA